MQALISKFGIKSDFKQGDVSKALNQLMDVNGKRTKFN
jgi:hypothetical protein